MNRFVPNLDTNKEDFFAYSHSHHWDIYSHKGEADQPHERTADRFENTHVPHHDASEDLLNWMDRPEKLSSSQTCPPRVRESVPAVEVPLSNLPFQDDEMLSWLQYPLEDSFDRNYCSEEIFTEAPVSHSNCVQDAFSYLTLKEGENPQSVGLKSQTFTPPDTHVGERNLAADVAMGMGAQRAVGFLMPHDTNTGDRTLAANAAMEMGAQRAAGLLPQFGSEAFNRVRTNAQPCISKRTHNVLPTQGAVRTPFSIPSQALRAVDTQSALKNPSQRLTKPNFPLFSCATAAAKKTSLQRVGVCSDSTSIERVRLPFNTHGKTRFPASAAESTATATTAGLGSPTLQARVSGATMERSSEAFHAHVKEGLSVSTAQSNATASTGMGSPRLQPYHYETTRQPFMAHLKEGSSASVTESTTTDVKGMGPCKLEAVASGPTNIKRARQLTMAHAKGGLSSCAAESTATIGPATCSVAGLGGLMSNIETGRQHFISHEGLPCSGSESTARDPSLHSERAQHGRETSQGITNPGKKPIAGKRLELSSCPVTASRALTPSEKLCETFETGDVTMLSPSRGSGNSTEKSTKEAAASTTKRKAHPAEDSEIESKDLEEGKPASGRLSGAKRTRAAEIHNLSERKRRNKINVKMKALQDLIPNANKTDKASILDEAIEYMKMLQTQVQLMSLRTGMVGLPMALPPGMQSSQMQQKLLPPHLNMGLGTSMGFGMDMGMFNATAVNGWPLSGSAYNRDGFQLGSSYPALQEAQGHMQQTPNTNGAYTLLPVQRQQQQQPLHLNMHKCRHVWGLYDAAAAAAAAAAATATATETETETETATATTTSAETGT